MLNATEMEGVCIKKNIFVILQVKAEEGDSQSIAPISDNLIDFTDLTPVVSQPHMRQNARI